MLALDIPAGQNNPAHAVVIITFFLPPLYWPDQLSKRSDKIAGNELDRHGGFLKREIFLGLRPRRLITYDQYHLKIQISKKISNV